MGRTLFLCLFFACAIRGADGPVMHARPLVAPPAANAIGPSLATGSDGTVWLTWLERIGTTTALQFSIFDSLKNEWSSARTIASGTDWVANAADFPSVAVGAKGRATAVWSVNNPSAISDRSSAYTNHENAYHAFVSETTDGGATWSRAVPLTRESDSAEFVSIASLANGSVLAVWIDGRGKKNAGDAPSVYARILGDPAPDMLVDASVCDCCQTALTAFPDGTALLSYRARSASEVRDVRVTRFRGRTWDSSRPLGTDAWKIAGCPVNGPQLTSDGGRVAAVWFTAEGNDARVLGALSTDAGAHFYLPLRISETKAAGRPAAALLHDGAILVTWVDVEGAAWLRRVSPDYTAGEPLRLSAPSAGRVTGFPRLVVLREYTGGHTSAQLLVTFTCQNQPTLRTLLVDVPEGDLLQADQNCDCAPSADQLQGFPIRGTIVDEQSSSGTLRVKHFPVPGIFEAGIQEFKVSGDDARSATSAGRQFLGRVERRDEAWWLFNVRLIAGPPAPN